VPIGFALQQTSLHVLADDLSPMPAGTPGELCIGGPGVALGYLHRPELTAERFVTEPGTGELVYRTGDVVRELPGGALEMLGRRGGPRRDRDPAHRGVRRPGWPGRRLARPGDSHRTAARGAVVGTGRGTRDVRRRVVLGARRAFVARHHARRADPRTPRRGV